VVSVAPLTPGGTYTLTYRICEILNPTNCDDALVTVEVIPTANLSITKTDAPDPVLSGNTLTWTITVSNLGPSPGENVVVTDAVPASVTSPEYSTNGGADWFAWTGSFNYPVDLASGSNFVLLLRGTVNPGTAFGSNISNTASVSSTTLDPVTANNTATAVTQVATSADLSITKIENTDPVLAGDVITWTISVTNNGPSDALSVSIADVVPVSVLSPQYSLDGGLSWNAWASPYALGTLNAGANFTFAIKGTINPSAQHGSILNNTVVVTSTTPDPNTGNNTSVASTTVNRAADLSIVKKHINPASLPAIVEIDPSVITAGTTIYYLLLVTNNGPSYAQNVIIADDLPAGITNTQYSLNYGNSWFNWNGTRILMDFEYPELMRY
jgi:uncharacterized repeat protein (TIGR01451 family)